MIMLFIAVVPSYAFSFLQTCTAVKIEAYFTLNSFQNTADTQTVLIFLPSHFYFSLLLITCVLSNFMFNDT